MNTYEVLQNVTIMDNVAEKAGFPGCEFKPASRGFVALCSRERWTEATEKYTSHRGRIDVTKAGVLQERLERQDRKCLRAALRVVFPTEKIRVVNLAHHNKLTEIAPGCVVLNN